MSLARGQTLPSRTTVNSIADHVVLIECPDWSDSLVHVTILINCRNYELNQKLLNLSKVTLLFQATFICFQILTYVVLVAIFNYVKVCIAGVLSRKRGSTGLLYYGIATQIGSLIGAIIAFILVNILKLFKSIPPCPYEF